MSENYLYMVFSNPVPGKEREFDDWYQQHMEQVVAVDGFVSGSRWNAQEVPERETPEYAHVVTYEISGPIEAALAGLKAAAVAGNISRPDPALVESPLKSVIYRKR